MDKIAQKKRIYEIVEVSKNKDDYVSNSYDVMVTVAIIVGLIPLMLKDSDVYAVIIDVSTVSIFLVDYILRLYTSDYKMGVYSAKAYIYNILSPMEIIDLLSILPILYYAFPEVGFLRMLKLIRIFRVFKLARYSRTMIVIQNVLRRVRRPLIAVLLLSIVYLTTCALIMFQVEPDLFDTFIDAFYWSAVSITTIGYGDYTPTTQIGKIITICSAMVGTAVIALPTGIITAAYMSEISKKKGKNEL